MGKTADFVKRMINNFFRKYGLYMNIFKKIKEWSNRVDNELRIEDYYFAKLGDPVAINKIKEQLENNE